MTRTGATRAEYTNLVWHYLNKRKILREKYPKSHPKYRQAAKKINYQLNRYRIYVRKIDEWNRRLKLVNNKIKVKYGVGFGGITKYRETNQRTLMLKRMFCKFVTESGIPSVRTAEFSNIPRTMVTQNRRAINKIISKDESTLAAWRDFREYIANYEEFNMPEEMVDKLYRMQRLKLKNESVKEK